MILKEKYSLGNDKQYYCKFTEELDRCAGFDIGEYSYYRHYLLDYRDRDRFNNYVCKRIFRWIYAHPNFYKQYK